MKRIFYVSLFYLLCAAPILRAQDAASIAYRQEMDENYKRMRATIEDLSEAKNALNTRVQSLEKQVSEMRAQMNKPTTAYASPEDLKRLAETVQEIDKKREADKKLILKEIGNLGSAVTAASTSRPSKVKDTPRVDDAPPAATSNQPTFSHTIKDGEYLSTIALAYREKGINVTVDQILKANPGLKPTQLYVGKKILIPDPRGAGVSPDSK